MSTIIRTPPRTVIYSDTNAIHLHDTGGGHERLEWAEIVEVAIVTNDLGPFVDDLEWHLLFSDGNVLVLSSAWVEDNGFLSVLQERFGEAFDNEKVIEACICTDNARFVCWRKGA